MGRIDKLKIITMARIEAFLASLETPETILPQLVKEMSGRVAEAARAEAKALTAVKADRRRLDANSGRVSRLQKGAMLAVKADKLDTARQAIAAQVEAERQLDSYRDALTASESAYESASAVRKQLQEQMEELKQRKRELLSRVQQIRQQQRVRTAPEKLTGTQSGSLLELVARMETHIETEEAQLEIQDQIRQTLGVTFEHERALALENDAEVDRRLESLRHSIEENS